MNRIIVAIMLLLAVASYAGAAQVEHYKLDNGLTVLLKENSDAPVVAIQIWLKAGADKELPGEDGMAHLMEHMFFKGTDKHPSGELDRIVENYGGKINAYTTIESVRYVTEASSDHAPELLDLMADALLNMKFNPQELATEQQVVLEEQRTHRDTPSNRLWEKIIAANFGPNHPYNKNILGNANSVLKFTSADMQAFYARNYRAANALLVVVGDFKADQIKPLIAQAFADFNPQAPQELSVPAPTASAGPQLVVMHEDVSQASINISYTVPGLSSPNLYALQMAADIMGSGLSSRLYWHLHEDQGLVDDVFASTYFMPSYGILDITATMKPERIQGSWQSLINEMYTLLEHSAQKTEQDKVYNRIKANITHNSQSMDQQATELGEFELLRGGYANFDTYADKFHQVSAKQIEQNLLQYLTPQNMRIIIQAPKGVPLPSQAQVQAWVEKVWSRANQPRPQDKRLIHTLPQGLTLFVEARPALPLVSMVLAVPHGLAAEENRLAGIHQLWASTITSSNQHYSYEQMALIQDTMGASLQGYASRNSMGMVGSFMAKDWQLGLDLMALCWQQPLFSTADIGRNKDEQLAELRLQESSLEQRAIQAVRALLYPNHPYGRDSLGNSQSIQEITSSDLKMLHKDLLRTHNAVLVVVGDVVPAEVVAMAEQLFAAQMPPDKNPQNAPIPPLGAKMREDLRQPSANQTHMALGFRAPQAFSQQAYTAQVLQAVLNGASGRLFLDLREKQGLAYSVHAFYFPNTLSGTFAIHMATAPENQQKAMDAIMRNLDMLRRNPISEQELARAKNYILGAQALKMQNYNAQSIELANNFLLGFGFMHQTQWQQGISLVTPEQLRTLAEQMFNPDNQATVILAP